MTKIKKLFETRRKAIVTTLCAAAGAGLVCAGTAYAASAISESASIGEDNAKNFAFADAGVEGGSAYDVKVEFDREQGQFVYEVEFISDGTEYDYWIKADDGSIVKKEMKIVPQTENAATQPAILDTDKTADGNTTAGTDTNGVETNTGDEGVVVQTDGAAIKETAASDGAGTYIGVDNAKSIALSHAGINGAEVAFSKAKLESDDGLMEYEIEFYYNGMEYDYAIDAISGSILEYDIDYD